MNWRLVSFHVGDVKFKQYGISIKWLTRFVHKHTRKVSIRHHNDDYKCYLKKSVNIYLYVRPELLLETETLSFFIIEAYFYGLLPANQPLLDTQMSL